MRLWSLNPSNLDLRGLSGCWREGLLALNVAKGNTNGYKNHPQMQRFYNTGKPVAYISNYLHIICDEADKRNYNFNRSKLLPYFDNLKKINVTTMQICYEFAFLNYKILNRKGYNLKSFYPYVLSIERCRELIHPHFNLILGQIESWEKVKSS